MPPQPEPTPSTPTPPTPNRAALSVVLPVRNVAPYLPTMFASLERNLEPEFEFIVIDDGSDDATPKVIEEYSSRLPLRVVRNASAIGLASARNAGLELATGEYVTFLDGDDWIAPGYLLRLTDAIDRLGCDFVRVDHVQVHGRDRVTHRVPEARRSVSLAPRSGIMPVDRHTLVDYPYAWAGAYRRDLGELLRFPAGLHTAEDRPWIWRLHREANSYAAVSLAGVFYRRLVANSLTQIGDERQLHFLDAFAMVLEQVTEEPDVQPKAIRQFLAVLAHQRRTSARFTRPVRRAMIAKARVILATLPPDALYEAMPTDSRSDLLRTLLPPAVRRIGSAA
ncbi:glycosyltransferase family 2 protein [Jatrophihabitans sp.]|uniref:glycosyltransferase family 2 protein n=1 Tax=Jatrophihabitans sp. TaxID=1932789 RepID=UPI0030C77BBC|nr:glycosyl transferase [Jatrophihabitans sp.]